MLGEGSVNKSVVLRKHSRGSLTRRVGMQSRPGISPGTFDDGLFIRIEVSRDLAGLCYELTMLFAIHRAHDRNRNIADVSQKARHMIVAQNTWSVATRQTLFKF